MLFYPDPEITMCSCRHDIRRHIMDKAEKMCRARNCGCDNFTPKKEN